MTDTHEELPPLNILLNQLEWNLEWLQKMEQNEPTEYFRNAALQRFEFTLQTASKCIRKAAGSENSCSGSLAESFRLAENRGWLPHTLSWKEMLQNYQNVKASADREVTQTVFTRLKTYRDGLQYLYERLLTIP